MKIAALDIETLDLDKNTAMISDIGVVVYDTVVGTEEFIGLRPNLLEQLILGRTCSKETVDFHLKVFGGDRDEFIKYIIHSEIYKKVSILESHTILTNTLSSVDSIWINGLSFDPAILESLYKLVGKRLPWNYKKEIDVRTINNLVNPELKKLKPEISFVKNESKVAHYAIADARWNLVVAQEFYNNIKLLRNPI